MYLVACTWEFYLQCWFNMGFYASWSIKCKFCSLTVVIWSYQILMGAIRFLMSMQFIYVIDNFSFSHLIHLHLCMYSLLPYPNSTSTKILTTFSFSKIVNSTPSRYFSRKKQSNSLYRCIMFVILLVNLWYDAWNFDDWSVDMYRSFGFLLKELRRLGLVVGLYGDWDFSCGFELDFHGELF